MSNLDAKATHEASTYERMIGASIPVKDASSSQIVGGYATEVRDSTSGEKTLGESQAVHDAGYFSIDSTPVFRP